MKSPMRYLAVAAFLAVSLTACARATLREAGATSLTTTNASSRHARTPTGCPLGRRLPRGQAIAVDYVDFLRYGRRHYIASAERISASQIGRVITHVRCSLAAEEDQRRAPPPVINRTASFLAAGSAIYQVRGYPPRCRLAGYLDGRLHVYLAQTAVHHHTAPVPCARLAASGAAGH